MTLTPAKRTNCRLSFRSFMRLQSVAISDLDEPPAIYRNSRPVKHVACVKDPGGVGRDQTVIGRAVVGDDGHSGVVFHALSGQRHRLAASQIGKLSPFR